MKTPRVQQKRAESQQVEDEDEKVPANSSSSKALFNTQTEFEAQGVVSRLSADTVRL